MTSATNRVTGECVFHFPLWLMSGWCRLQASWATMTSDSAGIGAMGSASPWLLELLVWQAREPLTVMVNPFEAWQ
jgi:hypothetical protein